MPKKGFIIAVSGGPATGKSTLVKKLAKHYQAKAFLEGEEKDFPPKILQDIKSGKNQLELTVFYRNKFFKEYLQALQVKNSGGRAILDTFYLTNEVYIEQWIKNKFEKKLAKDFTAFDSWVFPWPDLIVCLSCNKKKSLEFLAKRGRKFETSAKVIKKYQLINAAHDRFFKNKKIKNIIFIDRSNLNFENKDDLEFVTRLIDKKLSKR